MSISAALVKELRERTGAGMMECKKALTETSGDIDKAIENLRKAGAAKADKKAGRVAAEGVIAMALADDAKSAALVEVNCETDFVAKDENFQAFVKQLIEQIMQAAPADMQALSQLSVSGTTVDSLRENLIAKIGENIQVRRFERMTSDALIGMYQHGSRIGVLVELKGGDAELAKDIAMHIAASKPLCVSKADVPAKVIAKEKKIFAAQAKESGKPDEIIEKMIGGKIKKFLNEVTLLGQGFVKDPDTTIAKLLKSKQAQVLSFVRYEVGEGIEKKKENFADEVMAQVKN